MHTYPYIHTCNHVRGRETAFLHASAASDTARIEDEDFGEPMLHNLMVHPIPCNKESAVPPHLGYFRRAVVSEEVARHQRALAQSSSLRIVPVCSAQARSEPREAVAAGAEQLLMGGEIKG